MRVESQALIDAVDDGRLHTEIVAVIVNRRSAFASPGRIKTYRGRVVLGLRVTLWGVTRRPRRPSRVVRRGLAQTVLGPPRPGCAPGWMHLFTMGFLEHFPGRVVNLHPRFQESWWPEPTTMPGGRTCARARPHRGDGHLVPDEGVTTGRYCNRGSADCARRRPREYEANPRR